MLRTYKAIISNDRLKWLDDKPARLGKNVFVHVTILEKESPKYEKVQSTLVEFFQNSPLFASGIDLERDKDFGREVIL